MKKFLMTLAAVALATGAIMAQTPANNTALEEPDRIQTRHLSMNPSGTDIPTGYDKPQAVAQKHEQCKGHMDGQQCDKPADQPCDDCKARMVRMEIAEDSSVSVVETVIVDTAKADSLKGRFSQVEGKVVVALDNGAKWNFQVGNSGALSLLTGTGEVYRDENGMPADLIRIINKPKVEGEKP